MPGIHDEIAACLLQADGDTERLHSAENDGQVAGPLGDLAAAQFAFLLQFRQRLIHDGQQLQDDRCRDVRHDAEREDRQAAEVAAAEQVEKPEELPLVLLEELLQLVGVDARRGNVAAQAVHASSASVNRIRLRRSGTRKMFGQLVQNIRTATGPRSPCRPPS